MLLDATDQVQDIQKKATGGSGGMNSGGGGADHLGLGSKGI